MTSGVGRYWRSFLDKEESAGTRGYLVAGQSNAQLVQSGQVEAQLTGSYEYTNISEGETGMYGKWRPRNEGAGSRQQEALEHIFGNRFDMRAVAWVQGESDADTEANANLYEDRLRQAISDWRSEVPHLQVFIVPLRPDCTRTYSATVRTAQLAVISDTVGVSVVNCDDIGDFDGVHYFGTGRATMSQRIGTAFEGVS